MKKIFFLITVLIYQIPVKVFAQPDYKFPDFACLPPNIQVEYKGISDATCKIEYTNISNETLNSTGVLVNNTENDGKLYVLTAAHNLITTNFGSINTDLSVINSFLKNYYFRFFYQRSECYDNPANEQAKNSQQESFILKGAKLLAVYYNEDYEEIDGHVKGVVNPDLALLELLQTPNSSNYSMFFAGWNANSDGGILSLTSTTYNPFDDGAIISHPKGYMKKAAIPMLPKKRVISYESNYNINNGEAVYTISAPNPDTIDIDTQWVFTKTLLPQSFIADLAQGSSGAGCFNKNLDLYAIYNGGIDKIGYSTGLDAVWDTDEYYYEPLKNSLSSKTIKDFLSPNSDTMQLNGCYPCAAGANGLPLMEERRYLKTLKVSEEIPGDKTQSFVAQDEIQISSLIRPGARISFAAEQVLLGGGTNFERGSEVEITSGGKNGMSCATGCYSINIPTNPEHFFSNGSCFLKEIKNAENFTVQITLQDGTIYNLPEQPIHGSTVKLFELLDLKQNASAIKNTTATVKATFTNDCDTPKEVTFQITFDNALEDNAFLSDYYHYKEDPEHSSKMPSLETYMANKKALTQWYQTATSFQPNTAQYPEDVVFEIGVEKDITYAKASGYEWNFRGGKGYRTINPAITSGNGESSSHNTQIIGGHQFVNNGRLKMDIYYPKLKQGVSATQAPALPVICYVFGGGYVTHDQPELGDEICKWFAQKGYIVAFIDYRIGADLTNKEVSKRAPMRAWQDVNAAVQFLRMQGQKIIGVSDKWKIDPNKIYGNGWSAGAIASLHNLTLNQTQYQTERNGGNFLEFTQGGKAYTSLGISYTTYDLDAYPTTPCKPGETDCTGSNVDAQFNAVGVFAGAIGKPDWLNNLQRPAIDIHHHDDEIVLWGEGAPFKNVAPKTNFVGLTEVPPLYGGGYLKENFPNNTRFDVVTLTEEWQAGGKPTDWLSAGKLHASMIKWGDRAGVNHPARLENKEMFLLDGFFMNQGIQTASRTKSIEEIQIKVENPSAMFNLYPNPSNGKFKLDFYLKSESMVNFKIVNLNGRMLFEQKNQAFGKGNNSFSFNLANKLPSGLYFLTVHSKEFSETLKIIIE